MTETWPQRLYANGAFLVLIIVDLLIKSLPINTGPNGLAPPDFSLILTFAFVLRYPSLASPIVIAIALLFADFVLQRPPGLWAVVVFAVALYLRGRTTEMRENVFGAEWLSVAIGVLTCYVVYHFSLIFTFLPTQNLRLAAMQAVLTLLCYPIAVWLLHVLIRGKQAHSADASSGKFGR